MHGEDIRFIAGARVFSRAPGVDAEFAIGGRMGAQSAQFAQTATTSVAASARRHLHVTER
jgi:hypothetical protein